MARPGAPLGPDEEPETISPRRGEVAVGTVDVVSRGDAGTSGRPGLRRASPDGVFGPLLPAPVTRPALAFGPVVAIDAAGRSVLAFQEKRAPKAFGRQAPVYAVTERRPGVFGARQVLDRGPAERPRLLPYGTGALAVWETRGNRWRVAVERDGRFRAAPAPVGGPGTATDAPGLAVGGRFAGLAWIAPDGSVRASVGSGL